jgi:hypothetical protein
MKFSSWLRNWNRSLDRQTALNRIQRPRPDARRLVRPRLEALEDRTLLSTYLVTNTGDNNGINPAVGAGTGTLRQAIVDANAANTGTASNPDLIQFNIPTTDPGYHAPTASVGITNVSLSANVATLTTSGTVPFSVGQTVTVAGLSNSFLDGDYQVTAVTASSFSYALAHADLSSTADAGTASDPSWFTIAPSSALPAITDPIIINGYKQPGASLNTLAVGDNAVLKIDLDGSLAGGTGGLILTASNCTVTGMDITNFYVSGDSYAAIGAASNETIVGNFLGTDITGSIAEANNVGIGNGNNTVNLTIGGTDPAQRNIISGNDLGMDVRAPGSTVQGNYIGTDHTGTKALGNQQDGILYRVSDIQIGGAASGAGNVISANGQNGILTAGSPEATGIVIQGNFIGTNATGTAGLGNGLAAPNGFGVGDGINVEGDLASILGNVISANGYGLVCGRSGTVVQGNFIGTDVTGKTTQGTDGGSLGNTQDGVWALDPALIGGTTVAERNVISGNGTGIDVRGNNVVIQGNYIGTDITGTHALGNDGGSSNFNGADAGGIELFGAGTTVVGNLISGNGFGMDIRGGDGSGTVIQGNLIGTDYTGTQPLGNAEGIVFQSGGSNYTIGGLTAGAGNVISGNTGDGINMADYGPPEQTGNVIEGNFIGTNAAGATNLGNGGRGVYIEGCFSGTQIGGTTAAAVNVIADNGTGILLNGANDNVQGNSVIQGNSIIGNKGDGIHLQSSFNNMVGGTTSGAGNTIASNGGAGIAVVGAGPDPAGSGNSFLENSIHDNASLGIDLVNNNANDNQAAPVLTAASSSSSSTTVKGTLVSVANTTFRIEFFSNQSPDPSGYGEGQTYLASTLVTTDASGFASFTTSWSGSVPLGQRYLSATATVATPNTDGSYTYGDTSAFAKDLFLPFNFSGFLPPLNQNMAFALNRTIPIKFQLTDLDGSAITALGAVTSLQVAPVNADGSLGQAFNPTPAGGTGLRNDGSQYVFNWQTKGLSAGTYEIVLKLADGTTHTKTIQLTVGGSSAGLVTDGSSGTATAGALLGGEVDLYVDNSNGDLTSDELARIQDAVASIDTTIAPYGVVINEVSDPTQANVTLNMNTTSALGGVAQGVLGCTTDADQVTMIQGWSWYAGSDATQIGSGQYDFETAVMHELGHVLGLGHSSNPASVMYATLATGTANRALVTADLNVPDSDSGPCALHAVPVVAVSGTSNSQDMPAPSGTSIPSSGSTNNGSPMSGADQLFTDFTLLLSDIRNTYQSELSSVTAMWQSADAMELQRLDALLSMEAGAMGMSKDTLMHDLLFTSQLSPNGV